MMMKSKFAVVRSKNPEAGFTLLEVAISGLILMIGLVALLGVFTLAISTTQGVQLDQIAKQKAMDALESIYTARSTQAITFGQIANIGTAPGAVFANGTINGIRTDGPDGIAGTADDGTTPQGTCPLPFQCAFVPGPSGTMADAITTPLSNFTRTITITPNANLDPNLKLVVVTIGYTDGQGRPRNYTVQAVISAFR